MHFTNDMLLDTHRARDNFAQVYTHIQRHTDNACSEMMSFSLCFVFYLFFFIGSYKQYGITSIPLRTSIVALF